MFFAEFPKGVLLGWLLEVCVVLGAIFGEVSEPDLLLCVGWFGHDPTRGNDGISGGEDFWLVGCDLFNAMSYGVQVIFVLVESECGHC